VITEQSKIGPEPEAMNGEMEYEVGRILQSEIGTTH
jgi:hypothetical protein